MTQNLLQTFSEESLASHHNLRLGNDSRTMRKVKRNSVHLVLTSPPYWSIKNYGNPMQIGYGDRLTTYIKKLRDVWGESIRVLKPGCRLCINIGDQYIRADERTPYQIIPLHAYIVNDIMNKFRKKVIYLGSIIWQKIPTTRTTGGASVMGSYGYPRNGYVSYNYEYIAIFKKLGPGPSPPVEKISEKIELPEWRQLFRGIWEANETARPDELIQANEVWRFKGARQVGGIAIFPDELPARLLRMFTFKGDTVLDPFLGSGTTTKVAFEMGRNSIGYEVGFLAHSSEWREVIKRKIHYYELPGEIRDSIFSFD